MDRDQKEQVLNEIFLTRSYPSPKKILGLSVTPPEWRRGKRQKPLLKGGRCGAQAHVRTWKRRGCEAGEEVCVVLPVNDAAVSLILVVFVSKVQRLFTAYRTGGRGERRGVVPPL
jgi:hypothetical protein